MAKIVVDTPTREGLGFQDYADALVDIIVDSGSPFTIGILGEWGVGKTSLMQTMCGKLKDEHEKNVIPIWFNAWRCERERNLAIIPLLQLLVSEIKDKYRNPQVIAAKIFAGCCGN
jgi:predicted KAP-like P-loop ATPase